MVTCKDCGKDFADGQSLAMHVLAKHKTEEEQLHSVEQKKRWRSVKRWLFPFVGIVLIVWFSFWLISGEETYTRGDVHWHAGLVLTVCGENVPLPQPLGVNDKVHGEPFVGTPLMHLHQGPLIHVEGVIVNKEDITLGKFMKVIGLNFKDDELLDKKNGVVCLNGKQGRVRLLVDGTESLELSQKIIQDDENYEIRFE